MAITAAKPPHAFSQAEERVLSGPWAVVWSMASLPHLIAGLSGYPAMWMTAAPVSEGQTNISNP